ncbi:peptidylprolyl isomerase [Candidatus Kuenenia sp.]|uniref:FKBP-type peptidyl-prolyl cis-trans isomerase n=1 Tax=Candidatus Kuenenia sp. TaxID=2499824 RepID=UPI003220581B
MAQVKPGDTIHVHYTGKLRDGTIFDSSVNREPLEFTVGEGQLIPGFEQMVVGMNPGESRTATIPQGMAYGPYYNEMVLKVDRSQVPDNVEPKVGQQIQMRNNEDGREIIATITEVSAYSVTLDGNHPLAGKDLTFDVHLVGIL